MGDSGTGIAGSVGLMVALMLALVRPVVAIPVLVDPALGSLDRLVQDNVNLPRVDGLAFDDFGNLFASLEVVGSNGGLSWVDTGSGTASRLLSDISGVDQVALHPDGSLILTSELTPAQTGNRLFRVAVNYDAGSQPLSASAVSITTSAGISNPEGLVVLQHDSGGYGNTGDLLIAEDLNPGRVLKVGLGSDPAPTSALVDTVAGLRRPEGLAFGDFAGRIADAVLFAAQTSSHNVLRIEDDGSFSVFGVPSAVGLNSPDNLEFGPDGFLYVAEDRTGGAGRVLRADAAGNYSVIATGFSETAGLAFDAAGSLYISDQSSASIWRLQFAQPAQVPVPGSLLLMGLGVLLLRVRYAPKQGCRQLNRLYFAAGVYMGRAGSWQR